MAKRANITKKKKEKKDEAGMRKEVLLILDRFLLILFPCLFLPPQKNNNNNNNVFENLKRLRKVQECLELKLNTYKTVSYSSYIYLTCQSAQI